SAAVQGAGNGVDGHAVKTPLQAEPRGRWRGQPVLDPLGIRGGAALDVEVERAVRVVMQVGAIVQHVAVDRVRNEKSRWSRSARATRSRSRAPGGAGAPPQAH